ncbi:MAG: von Willebrand factor type A domain-containing protein [Acidobacteria bacterium OLB17]|nr:MAG: von Willebrand factor type A domain-containing protein [Acidobacteria bacterium OLB17]MCZ2389501.1 VWA domain-containing protein [Acidobacteriota bacterium]
MKSVSGLPFGPQALFYSLLLVLSVSAVTSSAQSGRKVAPTPTPTPARVPANYSESQPLPTRRRGSAAATTIGAAPQASEPAPDGEEVLRIETDLITVPVSVYDRNGVYVSGLTKDDFTIFEDGVQQKIEYFGLGDKPFTVVLLLDTSPSAEYKIDDIQAASRAFVDELKPEDKVIVIEFDGNVHVLAEATNDRAKLYKAISKADFGGGTSLYEAVDFSLKKRLEKIQGRKAIVLFTDGVDTTSRKASYSSTLDLAEESDTLIFPIYYNTYESNRTRVLGFPGIWSTAGTSAEDYAVGRKYLQELAAYTGGRVFRPEAVPGGLAAAFRGIAIELRRQYNIGYIPTEHGKPGQQKRIKVRVDRPNLAVRARDSYIVGTASSNAQ